MAHGPLGPLAFWEGFENELLTLAIYGVGIALYAVLVGLFYLTLSRRNLVDSEKVKRAPGFLGFIVVFPLVSFGLFLVLSMAMFFLAKEGRQVRDIMLLAMAVVAGVRVTAYVSERAAEDLAKVLPLGLLGVLIIDPGFLKIEVSIERIGIMFSLLDTVLRYLLVLVVLEVALRGVWLASGGRARARRPGRPSIIPSRGAPRPQEQPRAPARPHEPPPR